MNRTESAPYQDLAAELELRVAAQHLLERELLEELLVAGVEPPRREAVEAEAQAREPAEREVQGVGPVQLAGLEVQLAGQAGLAAPAVAAVQVKQQLPDPAR